MNKYIKWEDVKDSMTSLTDNEKKEIDLLSDIISQVIERRQELGISQRDLEKITGVKQECICRIEKMRTIPQLNTLIKLIEPLGLRLSISRA